MPRLFLLLFLAIPALAQTTPASVQAQGSASISVQPDQAQLTVSITTNGTTAQDAGQQNATLTAAGDGGTAEADRNERNHRDGFVYDFAALQQRDGDTGSNDRGLLGDDYGAADADRFDADRQAIDTANQAGATSVGNLTLGLQNPEPVARDRLDGGGEAGADCTRGRSRAGWAGRSGPVISAQEADHVHSDCGAGGSGKRERRTSVQPGPVSVSATVTVTVQLQ